MPFDFGEKIGDIVDLGNPDMGPSKFNPEGGFVMRIVNASIHDSQNNNPCLYVECDVAEGEFTNVFQKYPRRVSATLNNEVGRGIAKRWLQCISQDNPVQFPAAMLNTNNLDETKLVGCLVGAILKRKGKYSEIVNLCRIDVAKNFVAKDAPAKGDDKPATGKEPLPF